jgi:hypothetical protein
MFAIAVRLLLEKTHLRQVPIVAENTALSKTSVMQFAFVLVATAVGGRRLFSHPKLQTRRMVEYSRSETGTSQFRGGLRK